MIMVNFKKRDNWKNWQQMFFRDFFLFFEWRMSNVRKEQRVLFRLWVCAYTCSTITTKYDHRIYNGYSWEFFEFLPSWMELLKSSNKNLLQAIKLRYGSWVFNKEHGYFITFWRKVKGKLFYVVNSNQIYDTME